MEKIVFLAIPVLMAIVLLRLLFVPLCFAVRG